MNDFERFDLSPLDPARDPERWARFAALTRLRLLALAREIDALGCTVVALQEVQAHRYRRLLAVASSRYPAQAFEPFAHAPKGGLLTLARLPVERARFVLYRSRGISHPPALMDWMLHKGVLQTQVTLDGVPIVVLIFILGLAPQWFLARTEPAVGASLEKAVQRADELRELNLTRK